jgi:hypothetical protein
MPTFSAAVVTMVERASATRRGRWRVVEYRQDPPLLPPATSWMQGAAGIAAFLLRPARVAAYWSLRSHSETCAG